MQSTDRPIPESVVQIPRDLNPQRDGHGYECGCECDLEGGDSECTVQPPYESTADYCSRLRKRCATAESLVRDLARATTLLARWHHDTCGAMLVDGFDCTCGKNRADAVLSRIPKELK